MMRLRAYQLLLSPKNAKTLLLKMRAKSVISEPLILSTLLSSCPSKFLLRDNLVAASTVRLAMSLLFVSSLRIVQELEEPETSLFSNISISLINSVLFKKQIMLLSCKSQCEWEYMYMHTYLALNISAFG